jgi:hypothetical protein
VTKEITGLEIAIGEPAGVQDSRHHHSIENKNLLPEMITLSSQPTRQFRYSRVISAVAGCRQAKEHD